MRSRFSFLRLSIVACRMMSDGSCQAPCYDDDEHCNLTVVKIFLAKHGENKVEPPILQPLNEIVWHGESIDR